MLAVRLPNVDSVTAKRADELTTAVNAAFKAYSIEVVVPWTRA